MSKQVKQMQMDALAAEFKGVRDLVVLSVSGLSAGADNRLLSDGVWQYTEPDWEELKAVVTGHGPRSAERLALRRRFLEQGRWVREALA